MKYKVATRIRVVAADGAIPIGPGKADLLEAIDRTGSIRAAAGQLGMSYMRAWSLVRTMNAAFDTELVEKLRGGTERGGAILTARGHEVLAAYRAMEKAAARAIAPGWRRLQRRLR